MLSSKTVCCNILCLLFFSLLSYTAHAQVFANDAGAREKHFIYEVKQIDEFFERFNNDTGSFIRKEYRTRHIKYTIDRPKLIKSLFNYETKTWDPAVINNFVKEVTLTQSPINLNFLADGWFAEANCKFQYNGAPVDIPIILRIVADDRNRSRWMIAAVKSNILKASPSDDGTHIEENGKKLKFINPASHSNNFIELDKAFNDKDNLADYFEPAFFNRNNALVFYNAVLRSRIKFLSVHDITYHFLQAGKWIFTVQYFQRESLNAGWLINSLKKASADDKKLYLKNLLEE